MPELPEVETIRRGLESSLLGEELESIDIRREDMIRFLSPSITMHKLIGSAVQSIRRHGKFLLLECSNEIVFVIHLGMTGKLLLYPKDNPKCQHYSLEKHSHILFYFKKHVLIFHDVRRFGGIRVATISDMYQSKTLLSHLGPDAISDDFHAEYLYKSCKRHARKPIKSLLLDQEAVAGIGNIYADEALFLAGIRPATASGRLSKKKCALLYQKIYDVLQASILAGGSTLRDYRTADDHEGSYQNSHLVYGRASQTCYHCEQILKDKIIGGRRSVYCPNCQK